MSFELWVASRYFTTRKRHAFVSIITVISVVGVMIGVAALIVVLAVMTGFGNELRQRILGANADIVVRRFGGIEEKAQVLELVGSVPYVHAVSPLVDSQVLLQTDSDIRDIVLRGIDEKLEPEVTEIGKWMEEGELDFSTPDFPVPQGEDALRRGILLGVQLAERMNVDLGDLVTLVSSEDRPEFGGLEPKMRVFEVNCDV